MQEGGFCYLRTEPQCSQITQDEQQAQFLSDTSDGLSGGLTDSSGSLQNLGPVSTLLCLCLMIQCGPYGICRQAVWLKISSVAALLSCTHAEV